ncbi:MAG: hypothetical protein KKC80_08470 [Candidatus Margulisbacteria bacterium]|nr:hypothetical protein [Candidatus Margulisiibacteriota bacterium]
MPPINAARKLTACQEANSRPSLLNPGTQRFLDLFKRVREGLLRRRTAVDLLIRENDKLVRSIARKYENRGLALVDLAHEGNIGLCEAIAVFETRLKESCFENLVRAGKLSLDDFSHIYIKKAIENAVKEKMREVSFPGKFVPLDGTLPSNEGRGLTRHDLMADPTAYNPEEMALARRILERLAPDRQEALNEELPPGLPPTESPNLPDPFPFGPIVPLPHRQETSPRQKELAKELSAIIDSPGIFEQRFTALVELLNRKEISTSDVVDILTLLDRSSNSRYFEIKGKIFELLSRLPKSKVIGAKTQAERSPDQNATALRWLTMFYLPIEARSNKHRKSLNLRKSILAFLEDGGPPPEPFIKKASHGILSLITVSGTPALLSPLGCMDRDVNLSFSIEDSRKIVSVHETNGVPIRDFEIIKDSGDVWKARPIIRTDRQLSAERGRAIAAFILEEKEPGQEYIVTIKEQGAIDLVHFNGMRLQISALGFGERPAKISFQIVNGDKVCTVKEEDGRLIKQVRIYQSDTGLWLTKPLNPSDLQLAAERFRAIKSFFEGGPRPEQTYSFTIRDNGNIDLIMIEQKHLSLNSLGCRKREALVAFRTENGDRIVSVFEADRSENDKPIREYRIIKQRGRWQAKPLEISDRKLAMLRTKLILEFIEGKRQRPPRSFQITIGTNGTAFLFSLNRRSVHLGSLGCNGKKKREAIATIIKDKKDNVIVMVAETNGAKINAYLLASQGAINFKPPVISEAYSG